MPPKPSPLPPEEAVALTLHCAVRAGRLRVLWDGRQECFELWAYPLHGLAFLVATVHPTKTEAHAHAQH